MINFALVADAVIGNVQEKAMKKYGASNSEVVLYSYSLGTVYLSVALIFSGRLFPAITAANQVHKIPYNSHLDAEPPILFRKTSQFSGVNPTKEW